VNVDTGNATAVALTGGSRPGRILPNKEVSVGGAYHKYLYQKNHIDITYKVWLFDVDVVDNRVRHSFETQTDTTWLELFSDMQKFLNRPPSDVCLGVRISGETGGMTNVTCEPEWAKCLIRLRERILVARTRAVSIEIRNLVSVTACKEGKKFTNLGICSTSLRMQVLQRHMARVKRNAVVKMTFLWT
jgi:hypothetical protein